jgi:hypothetical protein
VVFHCSAAGRGAPNHRTWPATPAAVRAASVRARSDLFGRERFAERIEPPDAEQNQVAGTRPARPKGLSCGGPAVPDDIGQRLGSGVIVTTSSSAITGAIIEVDLQHRIHVRPGENRGDEGSPAHAHCLHRSTATAQTRAGSTQYAY